MPIEKVNKIVQEGTMMSGNRLIRWKMERKWIFEGEKSQKAFVPLNLIQEVKFTDKAVIGLTSIWVYILPKKFARVEEVKEYEEGKLVRESYRIWHPYFIKPIVKERKW